MDELFTTGRKVQIHKEAKRGEHLVHTQALLALAQAANHPLATGPLLRVPDLEK